MIPTRLRILRTSIRVRPSNFPIRTASCILAPRPHVQQLCLAPHAPRLLSTTSSLFSQKPPPAGPLENRDDTTLSILSPAAANPPDTTRPPPLELPVRGPDASTFSHLFATGKAYLTFYKTGLKNIYLNTRLVWSLDTTASDISRSESTPPPPDSSKKTSNSNSNSNNSPPSPPVRAVGSTTRSTFLLQRRWAHDVKRLPLFAVVLLICGELTPFIVLALPSVVPFTCRIPRQVEAIHRKTEERRMASFARLGLGLGLSNGGGGGGGGGGDSPTLTSAQAVAHIARSLNLISPLWDRLPAPLLPDRTVALIARPKVRRHLAFLEADNALLRQAGGAQALEPDEVVLACADRAMYSLGAALPQLRATLDEVLFLTEPVDAVVGETTRAPPPPTWAVIARTLVEKKRDHNRRTLWDRAALSFDAWKGRL